MKNTQDQNKGIITMRKIISFTHMSLDGYVAGPNGEMDWIVYDDEMVHNAQELTAKTGAALYGRVTYELMVGYWPTVLDNPDATPEERHHAEWVENIEKVVFSRTMDKATWNNTSLIKENIAAEIAKIKERPGQNMVIFGSPRLTHSLARLGLVDLYRININPVSIGSGIPLFEKDQPPVKLSLAESKTFANGVVGALYQVIR
jgi:dihydrofolate reductase